MTRHGNIPGMLLSPITCRDSRPVNAPSSFGNVAGTPGKVNALNT